MAEIVYLDLPKYSAIDTIKEIVRMGGNDKYYKELYDQLLSVLEYLERLELPLKNRKYFYSIPFQNGSFRKEKIILKLTSPTNPIYECRINHHTLNIGLRLLFFVYLSDTEETNEIVFTYGLIKEEKNPFIFQKLINKTDRIYSEYTK